MARRALLALFLEAVIVSTALVAYARATPPVAAVPPAPASVTDIVAATGIPVALHGGTGMSPEQFTDLVGRGCAKVNISTALKIAFMQSGYDHMTEHPGKYDPPVLFKAQRAAVKDMAAHHIGMFGGAGKAW